MTVADSRIDELRRRLERDPGSRLFAQLAEEHRKAGAHAEAIRVARAGLVQHPSYPSARLTLGRALLDSGDPAGARVELEAALRDAPDNILASRFLGQALEVLGELGPALVQIQKTLKMAPGDRHLESQIVSLQTRLRSPQPPPAPQVAGGRRSPGHRTDRATPSAGGVRAGGSRGRGALAHPPHPHAGRSGAMGTFDAAPAPVAPDRGPAGAGVRPAPSAPCLQLRCGSCLRRSPSSGRGDAPPPGLGPAGEAAAPTLPPSP